MDNDACRHGTFLLGSGCIRAVLPSAHIFFCRHEQVAASPEGTLSLYMK